MTDNEIINALECCENLHCGKCPYLKDLFCSDVLREDTHKLINRQKAEIEGLKKDNKFPFLGKLSSEIRAEAIKEFAERVKDQYSVLSSYPGRVIFEDINYLVKEMVGERE